MDPGLSALAFGVGKSRRYHEKMRRYYEFLRDVTAGGSALLGTGAFLVLVGGAGTPIATVLSGIVAAGSVLSIVFRISDKAAKHAELGRGFTALAGEIEKANDTDRTIRRLSAKRLKIEEDELSVRRLVDMCAYNEELKARGMDRAYLYPLTGKQQWWGYILTFGIAEAENKRHEAIETAASGGKSISAQPPTQLLAPPPEAGDQRRAQGPDDAN